VRRIRLDLLALLLCVPAFSADPHLTVSQVLHRLSANYQNTSSFLLEGVSTTHVLSHGSVQQVVTTKILFAGEKPDKVRLEFSSPYSSGLLLRDGKKTVDKTEGGRLILATRAEESGFQGEDPLSTAAYTMLHRFQSLEERLANAELAGPEMIEADGRRVRCYVLRKFLDGSGTDPAEQYWIDADRFVVVKSVVSTLKNATDESLGWRTTFTASSAIFNEPLSPKLFAIAPPPAPVRRAPKATRSSISDPGWTPPPKVGSTETAEVPAAEPLKSKTKKLKKVVIQ
jgi:outer membrane lipoprotein-sorting protein